MVTGGWLALNSSPQGALIPTTSQALGVLVHNQCGKTLKPGPFADESVPARGPGRPNAAEQREINRIGQETGCHTCGTTDPGTKSGNFVFDHQPPSAFNPPSQQGDPAYLIVAGDMNSTTHNSNYFPGQPLPGEIVLSRLK